MKKLFIDIESRSHLDLSDVGLMNYAYAPTTEITCIAWAIDQGPIKVWHYSEGSLPHELEVALSEKGHIVSHNSLFDAEMLKAKVINFLRRDALFDGKHWYDWRNHIDTMALGCYHRIGASLEDCAKFMKIEGKFAEGKKMMQKQTRLDKNGKFIKLSPEEVEKLKQYAAQDVHICREIYNKYPALPSREQNLWVWTVRNNEKGLCIDKDLLYYMYTRVQEEKLRIANKFFGLTGLKVGSIKFRSWLLERFYFIDNLQAATIENYIAKTDDFTPEVEEALKLKLEGSNSSLAKVKKAFNVQHHGKIYETLQFHKAQTKRWSGKGVQPQNFPRSEYKEGDLVPDSPDFKSMLITGLTERFYGLREIKNNLRRIFTAPKDRSFYCGDFSRIEPEVIFWLCDQGNVPARWYEKTAASIYKMDHNDIEKDSVERHVGKTVALSSLYGQGPHRFKDEMQKEGIKMTVAEAKNAIYTFRNLYAFIPRLWKAMENAFYQCMATNKEIKWANKNISFKWNRELDRVELTLPSGGKLFYNRPHAVASPSGIQISYWDMTSNKVDKMTDIWGGTLTEHLVSATAREVLATAVLRCEDSLLNVVCSVHDELWAYGEPGLIDRFKEFMEQVPHWAKGLRVKAECLEGEYYLK